MICSPVYLVPQKLYAQGAPGSGEDADASNKAKEEKAALLETDIEENKAIIYIALVKNKGVKTAAAKYERLPIINVKISPNGQYLLTPPKNGDYPEIINALDNANLQFVSDFRQEQRFDLDLNNFSPARRIDNLQAREEVSKQVIPVINDQINSDATLRNKIESVTIELTVSPVGFIRINKATDDRGQELPASFIETIKRKMKSLKLPCLEDAQPLKVQLIASITKSPVPPPAQKPPIAKKSLEAKREEIYKEHNLRELKMSILYTPRLKKLAEQCGRGTKIQIVISPILPDQENPSYNVVGFISSGKISKELKEAQNTFRQELVKRDMNFRSNSTDTQIELTLPEKIFADKEKGEEIKKQNILEAQNALQKLQYPKLKLAQTMIPGTQITFTIAPGGGYSSVLNNNKNGAWAFMRNLNDINLRFIPIPNQPEQVITLPLPQFFAKTEANDGQLKMQQKKEEKSLLSWLKKAVGAAANKYQQNMTVNVSILIKQKGEFGAVRVNSVSVGDWPEEKIKGEGAKEEIIKKLVLILSAKTFPSLAGKEVNYTQLMAINEGQTSEIVAEPLSEKQSEARDRIYDNLLQLFSATVPDESSFSQKPAPPKKIGAPMTEQQIRTMKEGALKDLRLRILNTPGLREDEMAGFSIPPS